MSLSVVKLIERGVITTWSLYCCCEVQNWIVAGGSFSLASSAWSSPSPPSLSSGKHGYAVSALIKPGILNADLFTDKTAVLFSPCVLLRSHTALGKRQNCRVPNTYQYQRSDIAVLALLLIQGIKVGTERRAAKERQKVLGDEWMSEHKERKGFYNGMYSCFTPSYSRLHDPV